MASNTDRGLSGEARSIRLLLVDDEPEFLQVARRALSRRGFDVCCAGDGRIALRMLDELAFDVVVLDVKMPGIDGVEVFRQIKHSRPALPVVLLTGHGRVQQAFEASKEGVYDYLSKPCDLDHLAQVAHQAALTHRPPLDEHPAPCRDANTEILLLLVDDERELLASLSSALERRGIGVVTATSGDEALTLANSRQIDVALIDLRLPGMDGLTLLKRLKAAHPLVEVLVLTGHPSMSSGVDAIRDGAFDCLSKPQSPELLLTKIREAFHLRRRHMAKARDAELSKILANRRD